MRTSVLAKLLLCLAVATPIAQPCDARSQKEKAAQQFEAFWNQRLDGYRTQAGPAGAKHKQSLDALVAKPFEFAEGDKRLEDFARASDEDAYVSGRGQELEAFLTQFKSRPSLGLMQAYLQQRISFVTALPATVEARRQEMLDVTKRPDARVRDLYVALETAAMARGDAAGRSEELKLIIENFGSYASEYVAADQRDVANRARWAAALSAMGQSLNRPTYHVSCMGMGNMVNCTGQ